MASTTLLQARQRAARELGPFYAGTASAGSTGAALVDNTWPILSTDAVDDLYTGRYLYRPNASNRNDKCRTVMSYVPAAGQLIPDAPWSVAPAAGEVYELHATIDPLNEIPRLLNQALKHIFLPVEFSFPTVVNQARHSLATAAPWLDNVEWIRQVGWLAPNEDRNLIDPYIFHPLRGRPHTDGNTMWIDHWGFVFNGLETFYVRAIKPSYYHCSSDGVTIDRAAGPVGDTDVIFAFEDWIAAGVLVEAWRDYAHVLDQTANQHLIRDRSEAAAWFTECQEKYMTLPKLTFFPVDAFGPFVGMWGPFR